MSSLTPLASCLSAALDGLGPVSAVMVEPEAALGCYLAEDLVLPQDMPTRSQALRAGIAVSALDLVGASPGAPVPLIHPDQLVPGDALPQGADAVLPEDGVERWGAMVEAIRPIHPGEGARLAGHDGRMGDMLASVGMRVRSRHVLAAHLVGLGRLAIRRPRVALDMDARPERAFLSAWLTGLGAELVDAQADLTLCLTMEQTPRLALAPAETAWLSRTDAGLVLDLPLRFDGLVAACLSLVLPTLARLSGASICTETRPLARKLSSTVGLSELVLLGEDAGAWHPHPAALLTLTGLTSAQAFAILPPESEGVAAGTPLAATRLEQPLG
jgi:molybdopterin biosynthesis enzyme